MLTPNSQINFKPNLQAKTVRNSIVRHIEQFAVRHHTIFSAIKNAEEIFHKMSKKQVKS